MLRNIVTRFFVNTLSDLILGCRSSRSQMFFKIGVLKNFAIFTGKCRCWSLFLIKLIPATSLKRDFNACDPNMSFSFEQEKNGKLSFHDVEVSREKRKFVTTLYRKPTFSGVYTHFESFLPTAYKFCMVYTLAYCCFKICSDGTKFHEELSFLKQVFLKNGYSLSFINNCFKTFVDKLFIKGPQVTAVEKKTLFLSLPYLGEIALQTRMKLRKSFKGLLNSCKLQIFFKSQRKLSNVFRFKDRLPFDLVSGVVCKYTCGRCNSTYYDETNRHLKVWSEEHIGVQFATIL